MLAPSHMYDNIGQNGLLLIAQAQLVPRAYKASTPLTTSWRRDLFTSDINPATRLRQFGGLRGRDLYDALLDLPRWVQAQELNHVLGDMDVLIIYATDIERCGFGATGLNFLVAHGFDAAMTKHTLTKRYNNSIQTTDDNMDVLTNAPYASDQPEPGPNQVIIHLPDHTGNGYILTKDYILRDWFSIASTDTDGFPEDACLLAKMDSIKDVIFMRDSITFWWA